MFLKNLLLGLGGTAAIGGIGYGIYASSQSNSEEKSLTRESEKVTKPEETVSGTGSDDEDSSQKGENTNGNNGEKEEKALSVNGTTPGTLPAT